VSNSGDESDLDPEQQAQIETVADLFEKEWKETIQIADYLRMVPEELRPTLECTLKEIDDRKRSTAPTIPPVPGSQPLASSGLPPVSATFGKFSLEKVLGEGGFGRVYRAFDTERGEQIALKILLPKWFSNPTERARFIREAEILKNLKRPNIVHVHEAGECQGLLYIASELVDGPNLADWLKLNRPSPLAVVKLLLPVVDAILEVHRAGWFHRDLKPENILIDKAGNPFVTDFGLAATDLAMITGQEAGFAGTVAYMAPEQLLNKGYGIGERTDVFALGVILYEMLTGEHPWIPKWRTEECPRLSLAEYARRVTATPAKAPDTYNPSVSAELSGVVERALKPNPHDRSRNCAVLGKELRTVSEPNDLDRFGRIRHFTRLCWNPIVGFLTPQSDTAAAKTRRTVCCAVIALAGLLVAFVAFALGFTLAAQALGWILVLLLLAAAMEGAMLHLTKPRTDSKTWAWPRIAIVAAFFCSVSVAGVQLRRSLYVIPTPPEFRWCVAMDIDQKGYGGPVPPKLAITISLTDEGAEQFSLADPMLHDLDKDPVQNMRCPSDPKSDSKWEMSCPHPRDHALHENGKYRMTVKLKPRNPAASVDKNAHAPDPNRLVRVELVPPPEKPLVLAVTDEQQCRE